VRSNGASLLTALGTFYMSTLVIACVQFVYKVFHYEIFTCMYIILKLNFYYTKSLIYMYDYVYRNK